MNYIQKLEGKIEDFVLRRLSYNDLNIIDYSKSPVNIRYISFMDLEQQQNNIATDLLLEVIADSMEKAEDLMLKKLNLVEQFKIDFNGVPYLEIVPLSPITLRFQSNVILSKLFVGYYIWNLENNTKSIAIITFDLDKEIDLIILWVNNFIESDIIKRSIQMSGEEFDTNDIIYNNVVYLYTTQYKHEKSEIQEIFKENNLVLKMRDNIFRENSRPDFFICHDSRDKVEIVKPLAETLQRRGKKVWYDEYSMEIGDSLTETIQKGIIDCKYAIVILSPNFLANEKWVKYELQSILTKQIYDNKKTILPIWHKISEKDLVGYSYYLLEKLAGNTANGVEELAEKLVNIK